MNKSRFDILNDQAFFLKEKKINSHSKQFSTDIKYKDNIKDDQNTGRFAVLSSTNNINIDNKKFTRNINVFDTISNKNKEEYLERQERNSHIKFRNKETNTIFESYVPKTYQKQVNINSIEEFPILDIKTEITPNKSNVWSKKINL
jgi:hypothetical protein